MRAILVALLVAFSAPAYADECRYFAADRSASLTSNEEDMVVTLHWNDGRQETCDLAPTGEADRFSIQCANVSDMLVFEPEPGNGATFLGREWHRECFEQA